MDGPRPHFRDFLINLQLGWSFTAGRFLGDRGIRLLVLALAPLVVDLISLLLRLKAGLSRNGTEVCILL